MATAKAKDVETTVLTPIFDGAKRYEVGEKITLVADKYEAAVKQGVVEETMPIESGE